MGGDCEEIEHGKILRHESHDSAASSSHLPLSYRHVRTLPTVSKRPGTTAAPKHPQPCHQRIAHNRASSQPSTHLLPQPYGLITSFPSTISANPSIAVLCAHGFSSISSLIVFEKQPDQPSLGYLSTTALIVSGCTSSL